MLTTNFKHILVTFIVIFRWHVKQYLNCVEWERLKTELTEMGATPPCPGFDGLGLSLGCPVKTLVKNLIKFPLLKPWK
jgi:hypothetical protein